MKVIICCIAKQEEDYIKDFCDYHLKLGFDEIHLYDNNNKDYYPKLKDIFNDNRIVIHEWFDKTEFPQRSAYQDCIDNINYDWCAFIDVDEFITLTQHTDIHDFINSFDSKIECIRLCWKVIGDDDIIENQSNKPIYERLFNESGLYRKSSYKSIVKKFPIKVTSCHFFTKSPKQTLNTVYSNGEEDNSFPIYPTSLWHNGFVEGRGYIRHYMTKTLSEFVKKKMNRTGGNRPDTTKNNYRLEYFFGINEITQDKIDYLIKHHKDVSKLQDKKLLNFCPTYKDHLVSYYKKRMGKILNLENPKTFTEKIQWLKLNDSTPLKTYCANKITLHEYCKYKLGKDLCIPLLGIYDNVDQIDFDILPNSFVIKCNHGCQMNIKVRDKTTIDLELTKQKLTNWLEQSYNTNGGGCEFHYLKIPHKILVEEYKENTGVEDLVDYKFYCFNGKPAFCQVISDRNTREKISHYDLDWNYKPEYERKDFAMNPNLQKPTHYNEMIEYAKLLSNDFKFVRVDFYEIDDKVYLGELTFTPLSGFLKFKDKTVDEKLGKLLKL